MKKLWLLALLVPLVCMAQEPNDESTINCKNLISFGSGEFDGKEQIFGKKPNEWDSTLLSQLKEKTIQCYYESPSFFGKKMDSKVRASIENKLHDIAAQLQAVKKESYQRQQAEKKQALLKVEQDDRQKRQELNEQKQKKAALLEACHATKEYDSYDTQEALISVVESHQYTIDAIQQQRKFEKESGVRNLYEVRKLGEDSVQEKERIAELWAYYKKNGGKANNPAAVKHTLANPCKEPDDSPH